MAGSMGRTDGHIISMPKMGGVMEGQEVDWKRLVQFALLGSSDLDNMPSCWYAFRSGGSSPSPGQTNCLSPAARNLFTKRSLRPMSRFPVRRLIRIGRRVRLRILADRGISFESRRRGFIDRYDCRHPDQRAFHDA